MSCLRNSKLVAGAVLVICGVSIIVAWLFHVPAREISRTELDQFLGAKSLLEPVASPTPYAGIDHIKGWPAQALLRRETLSHEEVLAMLQLPAADSTVFGQTVLSSAV